MEKAYIVLSHNYFTGKRKTSPTIFSSKDEAIRGLKHSLARSMRLLTKSDFSIYSLFYNDTDYEYVLVNEEAYIYKRNSGNGLFELYKFIRILEISVPIISNPKRDFR